MKTHGRIVVVAAGALALTVVGWMSLSPAVQAQAPAAPAAPAQAARPAPIPPDPSTQLPAHLVTADQLLKWEKELSNWGRWPDNGKGALNLITPAKSKAAIALAKTGEYASLHHFPEMKTSVDNNNMNVEFKHWNTTAIRPETGLPGGALDAITMALHDGGHAHMDALCHYAVYSSTGPGKTSLRFNGVPQKLTKEGCLEMSVDKMGKAYVTRGILIDMPLLKGVKYLAPHTPVYPEDLDAWEKFAKVTIGPGDIIFLRSGRWALRNESGPWNAAREIAGLHASTLPWLHKRDVSGLAGEGVIDVQPSGTPWNRPIHSIGISIMGSPTIDNVYMEDAAEIAARLKRWEFMLSWAAMQVPDGTATPFAAVATF